MSNIYVYPSGYVDGVLLDDSETDFSTAGLVGALFPTSCTFREVRNNERIVTLEHPLDEEGRYKALVKGYILSVRVPVMTVPATSDSIIDITWNGTKTDFPSNPTNGYAFFLQADDEDEDTIDANYYYGAALAYAWRNSSTNVFTLSDTPIIGDPVYIFDSADNIVMYGSVGVVNKSGDTVTSIKIVPNMGGTDSRTFSKSALYDRVVSGAWYKFGTDGSSIIWKGSYSEDPLNPQTNWAYKNTTDGFTYYYANGDWVRLCDSKKSGFVWKYRLKSTTANDKKQRTVYKKKKGGGKLAVLNAGEEVFVIEKDEDENKRWKVRTTRNGEGYMDRTGLELVQGGEYDIRDNWKMIQEVVSPWIVTTQLFRIYKVNKTLDSIKIEAKDVASDSLNNIFASSYAGGLSLDSMLKSLKNDSFSTISDQRPLAQGEVFTKSGYEMINFLTPDGYLVENITKNEYKGKTLTDVMLNEENGICAKYNVIRVTDNYNVYFIKDPGINRGFTIQYGKNMTGVDYEVNDDEIVTAVIPVGKNKKGDPLYLGPQKSKDEKKNYIGWYGNIIWSINKDKFPTKRFYVLDCDAQAKSNSTKEIGYAMDKMRYLAESKIHAANKVTNAQDGDMDEPKITATVEFVNLGDTEEYKQFKNLEKCFLHDYVTIRHPDLGIDITARVTEMEWDCLLDRMNKITLGNIKENEGRAAQYAQHQAERDAYLAGQIGSDAYDQASSKKRVFTDGNPYPPYDIGDLWITADKDLMVCVYSRTEDEEFSSYDWDIATKYTDTGLNWKGTFASVEELIEEYGDPENGWAYRNSTTKKSYYYQNGSWNVVTEDGFNGKNTAIVYLYKRSTTAPSVDWTADVTYSFPQKQITSTVPTGWSKVIPSGTNPLYVTAATAYSENDTDTIGYDEWADPVLLGESGVDGLNSATIILYKRSDSKPTGTAAAPIGSVIYTFSDGSMSGNLNGWSREIPSGSSPCWTIQATAVSTNSTDTIESGEWSDDPAKLVVDGAQGEHGISVVTINLYKRSQTTPSMPTGTLTYSFADGSLTPASALNGWSMAIPASNGYPCFNIQKTVISTESTVAIYSNDWSSPIIAVQDGEDGADGADGQNGNDGVGISNILNYYLATNQSSGVTRATSGWTTAVQQTSIAKKYLWNYEEVTLTNNTKSYTDPAIVGNYAADGTAGRSVESIVEYYAVSASNSTAPSSWYTTPQQMTQAMPYLWNYEVVRYSTGDPEETAKRVIGAYGTSVSGTTQYYYISSTAPSVPTIADPTSLGWTTTQPTYIPGSTDKVYTTIKTTYSTNAFSYSPVSELYSNTKIDTFIVVDNSGNTIFKNSANDASVLLDSVDPSVNLRSGNTVLAKFSTEGIDFGTGDVAIPAFKVIKVYDSVGHLYKYHIGINCTPIDQDFPADLYLPQRVLSMGDIFCDVDPTDLSYSVSSTGNFNMVQDTSLEDIYENSRVEVRTNGQYVEISGIITPKAQIPSGSMQTFIEICEFPQIFCPDREVHVLCHGNTTQQWLLTARTDCKLYFSSYRNGGSFVNCPVGAWLPFKISWFRTSYPSWVE